MLLLTLVLSSAGARHSAREMYDSISMMMSGEPYSAVLWEERIACMDSVSPDLVSTMENAWAGMEEYWLSGGGHDDPW